MSKPITGALRLALLLYPAAYRRERQDEIAGVVARTTEGAGRTVRARELFDVAGHGLRVRTALTSGRTPGRIAAGAAPVVVGAAGGWAVWTVLTAPGYPGYGGWSAMASWAQLAVAVVWLLAMGAALFGRWTVARGLAAPAAVGTVVQVALLASESAEYFRTVGGPEPVVRVVAQTGLLASGLMWSLLLMAAPPDLVAGPSRQRQRATAIAFVTALAVEVATAMTPSRVSNRVLIPLAIVCVALLCARRERLLPLGVALAFLPLGLASTLLLFFDSLRALLHGYLHEEPYGLVFAIVLLGCATVAGVRLRRARLSRAC